MSVRKFIPNLAKVPVDIFVFALQWKLEVVVVKQTKSKKYSPKGPPSLKGARKYEVLVLFCFLSPERNVQATVAFFPKGFPIPGGCNLLTRRGVRYVELGLV